MSVVCRICLDGTAKNSQCQYYSLNDESDSCVMKIKSKLKECFPEFMVDIIKDSVICNNCVDALDVMYKFRTKFMETEKKIFKYMEEGTAKCNKPIDINLVLKWLPKHEAYKKHSYVLPKRGKKKPISEAVVPSNIYDCYVSLFDVKPKSDTNINSEPIDESDTSSAFKKLHVVEINWNDKNVSKSPENLNCSTSQVSKSVEGVLPELLEVHNPDIYTNSNQLIHTTVAKPLKSDVKEKSVDFRDNYTIKDVLIGTEKAKEPPRAIISDMSYDYDYFSEFEMQFAGYTIDALYSNQLIAMPECSVVVDRLSNQEIKRWTEGKIQ